MKNEIAIKIALIYFLFGFQWILFSDQIIQGISTSAEAVSHLQTIKGWSFVSVTAILLFLLVRNEIKKKNLIEAELIKAKEKAEESDRLKSAFLENMSHEIRTPLNGILGFCELILDDSFDKEDKLIFAKNITKNGNDFLKLINDIMDISKIQENQYAVSKKHFNINVVLDKIYKEYHRSELRKHRSRLDFQLIKDEENPETELYTDPEKLTRILQNLLNNSFFFTNEGFVHFGYRKLASGFEFFVEDSGCGIDDNDKKLIFRPFFKGNDPVIGNRGFGLGLAINKGLVNLLGGELKFDSIPKVGSRFYFTIDNQHLLADNLKKKVRKSEIMKAKEISFDPSDIRMNQN